MKHISGFIPKLGAECRLHISEADLLFSSNVPSGVTLFSKPEWEATQQTQAEPQSRSSEQPGLPEASSSIELSNSTESPSTKPSEQDDELRLASDVNHLQANENAPGDECEKPNNSHDDAIAYFGMIWPAISA